MGEWGKDRDEQDIEVFPVRLVDFPRHGDLDDRPVLAHLAL